MLNQVMTKLFGASRGGERPNSASRPKARLGCEQFEDRITPSGWLDDYASYFPDIGLGEHVIYPVVNVFFDDDTLANATDTQLAVGTATVVVVAVVGAEVVTVAATGTSIGGALTGAGATEGAAYGGPQAALQLRGVMRQALQQARSLEENQLAGQIASVLEKLEMNILRNYPGLF